MDWVNRVNGLMGYSNLPIFFYMPHKTSENLWFLGCMEMEHCCEMS